MSTRSSGLRSVAQAIAPKAKKVVATKKAPTTPKKAKRSQISSPSPKKSPGPKIHHASTFSTDKKAPLIALPDDVVTGKLVCRPSKRNRSPYVADVFIESENREAIAHVPNLDMGGELRYFHAIR